MGDIGTKIDKFIEIFINNRGYVKVLEGLKNTLIIAVIGLVIGVVIGTLIAMVRVIPKYKRLPRVLDAICRFYVGLFRGTPMVVQLLVFYYVSVSYTHLATAAGATRPDDLWDNTCGDTRQEKEEEVHENLEISVRHFIHDFIRHRNIPVMCSGRCQFARSKWRDTVSYTHLDVYKRQVIYLKYWISIGRESRQ